MVVGARIVRISTNATVQTKNVWCANIAGVALGSHTHTIQHKRRAHHQGFGMGMLPGGMMGVVTTPYKEPDIDTFSPVWESPWGWRVIRPIHLSLGERTDIGAYTLIQAAQGVTIEDDVQIGSHCSIYSVSTIDGKQGPVVLKKNCRIGTHSVIMPNVTIGENTIVGAFSFVNRSVGPNQVIRCVPYRFRRMREV
jgi:hypothetical protein